jgi:acyltransferase
MFPLIIKTLHRLRKAQPKLLTVVLTTLICAYFVIIRFIPENMVDAFVYVNPAFRLLDFFIGILLWQLYRGMTDTQLYRRIIRIPRGVKTIIEAVAVIIFCAFTLCYPFVPPVYSLASYWWIPTAILILTFSVFSEQRGWLSELLNRSFLIKFGNISFSFYMIHTLVYLYLKIILTKLNILPADALMLVMTFILTTILAYAVNRWFEKPMASLWMSRFGFRAR